MVENTILRKSSIKRGAKFLTFAFHSQMKDLDGLTKTLYVQFLLN